MDTVSLAFWFFTANLNEPGINRHQVHILTIKWFAIANLLNVSIYAGKWLALALISLTSSAACPDKLCFVSGQCRKPLRIAYNLLTGLLCDTACL
ncbi:hypothetical protein IX84_25780 [Phaeodactylibacter xiamenensis]|uniref:Uncharacterized protein n=1 Tax=Phaeodactylibacter xiamenensis TaxID=1524460 RepID=A0A098S482_9BACT|nr:hypothetical protein IX84_25780 [Phaeodactylibacter xiamenensis]